MLSRSTGWRSTFIRLSHYVKPLVFLLQTSPPPLRKFQIGLVFLRALPFLCWSTLLANVRRIGIRSTKCVDNIVVALTDRRTEIRAPPCWIQNRPNRYTLLECSSPMAPVSSVLSHVADSTHFAATRRPPFYVEILCAGFYDMMVGVSRCEG